MLDPVIYDLNRYLAEESRAQAREERLEAICAEVREETETALFPLKRTDFMTPEQALKATASHEAKAAALVGEIDGFIDNDKKNEALVALFRGQPEAKDMLTAVQDDALDAYIQSVAEERLRHLEEIEAEDRALAANWSTPSATDGERGGYLTEMMTGTSLPQQVKSLWSTPNAHDGARTGADIHSTQRGNLNRESATWPTPKQSLRGACPAEGKRHQPDLAHVSAMWPTPASRDCKGTNSETHATVTGGGKKTHGSTAELRSLFAPGPADRRWGEIIRNFPEFAPATESPVCGMADGVAERLDECRPQRLRCIGNGVVPLQAATAFVVLAGRAGMRWGERGNDERRDDAIRRQPSASGRAPWLRA